MFLYLLLLINITASASEMAKAPMVVTIPYMERASAHRDYADALLKLALELSSGKYGPYDIIQQRQQTVIRRQLVDLEGGKALSVAVSMPMPEWRDRTLMVRFPIMQGLASYRMFLAHKNNKVKLNELASLAEFKQLKIGQGQGWSTGKLLEANGFQVVYGGPYATLVPMLNSDRFHLLMRGVYEIAPEFSVYSAAMPNLYMVDNLAVYTYLPMYFFVSKRQPILAARLEYGLKKAYESGQFDALFQHYFSDALKLLSQQARQIFYLENINIDASYFEHDKPYLLDSIRQLEIKHPH